MFYLGKYNELFVSMSICKDLFFMFKISMTNLEEVWKQEVLRGVCFRILPAWRCLLTLEQTILSFFSNAVTEKFLAT